MGVLVASGRAPLANFGDPQNYLLSSCLLDTTKLCRLLRRLCCFVYFPVSRYPGHEVDARILLPAVRPSPQLPYSPNQWRSVGTMVVQITLAVDSATVCA